MSWEALIGNSYGSGPHMLSGVAMQSHNLGDLYNGNSMWPLRNMQTFSSTSDRPSSGILPHQESALQHVQILEAQHSAVLQQIAALQQHSQDLQNQEQSLTAVIMNEISQKFGHSSYPIQALLQQMTSQGSHNPFPSAHSWLEHSQGPNNSFAFSLAPQDEALMLHLHKHAALNHQVNPQRS